MKTAQFNVFSLSLPSPFFFLLPSLPLNLSKSPSTLGHGRRNGCLPVNSAVVLGKPTIMSARSEAIVLPSLRTVERKSRGRVKTASRTQLRGAMFVFPLPLRALAKFVTRRLGEQLMRAKCTSGVHKRTARSVGGGRLRAC